MRNYVRDNLIFILIIAVIAVGAVIFAVQAKRSNTGLTKSQIKTIEGVKEFGKLDNKHIDGQGTYAQSPPAGGNHNPVWIACDAKTYDQELPKEMAVHSLEHGAVWITYLPSLEKSKIDVLKEKAKASGATFSSPYGEQNSPIVLTAWSRQLEVQDVNDPRIDQFMVKYRKSPDAPEPGATCADPKAG